MKMRIRKAAQKDAKTMDEMNKRYFHERGRNWKKLISENEMFVLELNDKIIGFTGLEYHRWNNTSRIICLFIHPNSRNMGYGSKVVKYLIKYLKNKKYRALIAEAPSSNPVLNLYLKNGFRICGFNDRYYSNRGKEMAVFLSYDFS